MTSIAQMKAAVLASGKPAGPTTATLLGQEVGIRPLTSSEEAAWLAKGTAAGAIPICAACIVDGMGAPVFTREELGALKAGALTDVYKAILAISYPETETTKKKS